MALYARLIGIEGAGPRIPVHQFMASMGEYKRGFATPAQIIAAFNLSAGEQVQVTTLIARIDSNAITPAELHDVLLLGAGGVTYTTEASMEARLGV